MNLFSKYHESYVYGIKTLWVLTCWTTVGQLLSCQGRHPQLYLQSPQPQHWDWLTPVPLLHRCQPIGLSLGLLLYEHLTSFNSSCLQTTDRNICNFTAIPGDTSPKLQTKSQQSHTVAPLRRTPALCWLPEGTTSYNRQPGKCPGLQLVLYSTSFTISLQNTYEKKYMLKQKHKNVKLYIVSRFLSKATTTKKSPYY